MLNFFAATSQSAGPLDGLISLVILLVVFPGIGGAARKLFQPRSSRQRASRQLAAEEEAPITYPFQRRKHLLSAAERSFYEVLRRVVGGRFNLFLKVRLADIVYVERGTGQWQSHFNRIQSKHVDFLLCDAKLIAPMTVIELDDSSHDREDRKSRDKVVDAVCKAAGLRVIRIRAQRAYSPESLRTMLGELAASEI